MRTTSFPIDPGPAAWNEILPPAQNYQSLEQNITSDWLVIGAGFAGLSAARRLLQLHPGETISVLEARRIAEGPAGRNSGFMIDLPHDLSSKSYTGALNTDINQINLNRAAIDFAILAADEYGMDSEAFCMSGKTNAAATQKGLKHNTDYASHLDEIGERYEFLDQKQMFDLTGSDYYLGGLYTPGTAVIQPALYIRELAEGLSKKPSGGKNNGGSNSGVTIYENSPVKELKSSGKNWFAKTPKGQVEAPKVILAVNGHAESFGFYKKRLMHVFLYASMTRALTPEEMQNLGGETVWGCTPSDPMGSTVRKISGIGGTRIVIRNQITWNPTRRADERELSAILKNHKKTFYSRFPKLKNVEFEYSWGGLLCLSRNNVSAFGQVENGLFSACCQNGLGTAKGTLSGFLAAELASHKSSRNLDILLAEAEPSKLPPEPFCSIGARAFMRWGQYKAGAEL